MVVATGLILLVEGVMEVVRVEGVEGLVGEGAVLGLLITLRLIGAVSILVGFAGTTFLGLGVLPSVFE